MSARIWTREELDRVHPLPGWRWHQSPFGGWHAVAVTDEAEWDSGDVVDIVCGAVRCRSENGDTGLPPCHVALAVILASQGLDSREAMADACGEQVRDNRHRAGHALTDEMEIRQDAMADAWHDAEAMLRRGTVDL
jgi:hypothetical protein